MAAGAWLFTDAGRKGLFDGTFDLDALAQRHSYLEQAIQECKEKVANL